MRGKREDRDDKGIATHKVDNLPEVNFHAALLEVRIPVRVMDELGQFPLTHLRSPIPENKKESIYGVRLSRPIGADNRRE
jgi:hypothetical protein